MAVQTGTDRVSRHFWFFGDAGFEADPASNFDTEPLYGNRTVAHQLSYCSPPAGAYDAAAQVLGQGYPSTCV
jgi:hypothetical protein